MSDPKWHLPVVYDANTPVWRPLFDRSLRAAIVFGIEWSSLSLIEDAPRYVKIATLVIAVLVLAVLESRYFLILKGRAYFPALIGSLIAAYIGIVAYASVQFQPSIPFISAKIPEAEKQPRDAVDDIANVNVLPTKIRILFKHAGKPEEIDAKNITWTWMIPTEHVKNPNYAPAPVTSPSPSSTPSYGGFVFPSPMPIPELTPGTTLLVPSLNVLTELEYIGVSTWMIFLVFDHKISYKNIVIDDHGSGLSKPEIWIRPSYAIVWFHCEINNALVDFTMKND